MDMLTETIREEKISIGTRLGTMLLDHVIMTGIMMIFFLPSMMSVFIDPITGSNKPNPDFLAGSLGNLALFGFSLYFCKDIINGRSFAKRILKLQLVNNSTGQVADPIRCFVRNIFCILWPIEVIVGMTNTTRRIGDFVAGTKLIEFNPSLEQPRLNIGKIVLVLAISYGLILLLTLGLRN